MAAPTVPGLYYFKTQVGRRPKRCGLAPGTTCPSGRIKTSQLMEFTSQPYQRARAAGARSTSHRTGGATISTATSLACAAGFREARDRLLAQFEPAVPDVTPAPDVNRTLRCHRRFARRTPPLETSFCWLTSAAALAWLLLSILGL
jgi:hypothetical protein